MRNQRAFGETPSTVFLACLLLVAIVGGPLSSDANAAGGVDGFGATIATVQAESAVAGPSVSEQALSNRLVAVGILMGVVVAMVAVIYGYLKLELITRGFYSGRLQVAATVLSLVIAVGAYFLWIAITAGVS
jgi:hypothetical protein